jgi:tRNA 2-thiouridine synthesizing protein A
MSEDPLIDARGLRCPWPALRLAREMRGLEVGATLRLLADDPAAPREIAALAAEHGWAVEPIDGGFRVRR